MWLRAAAECAGCDLYVGCGLLLSVEVRGSAAIDVPVVVAAAAGGHVAAAVGGCCVLLGWLAVRHELP